jgi:outer membrane lipoprotein-sorting protein
MMTLLLTMALCGCVSSEEESDLTLQLRSDFLAMEGCTGAVTLTADYGQRVYEYTAEFSGTEKEGYTIVLTSPEEVAGITALIQSGQTYLTYDDIRLETGPLDDQGLSPLDALPALVRAMQTGYIAETGSELLGDKDTLRLCCRDPDQPAGKGLETVLWFDKAGKTLVQGELRLDGATAVRCAFSSFTLLENTD